MRSSDALLAFVPRWQAADSAGHAPLTETRFPCNKMMNDVIRCIKIMDCLLVRGLAY